MVASTNSAKLPDGYYTVPIGKAAIRRVGADVTVLAYGTMVHVAEAAADDSGIDAEIIDLRTLVPLDIDTIYGIGRQDRPLRHRARGHTHVGVRRRTGGAGAGALLLSSGGADRCA